MQITFVDLKGDIPKEYFPIPASKCLPDWYKKTNSYISENNKRESVSTPMTIKKCVPVFDAMSAGYIIHTMCDVEVTSVNNSPWYTWSLPIENFISFHPINQAENHPQSNSYDYPKWVNPWSIQTPKGYSCLFLPPMHHQNNFFTVLPAIVDTDKYNLPIHFPFVLNDSKWTGIIPAGTPMVQIIPFKRKEWNMKIGSQQDVDDISRNSVKFNSKFFSSYKKFFWSKKTYN